MTRAEGVITDAVGRTEVRRGGRRIPMMSKERLMSEPLSFEKVSIEDAKKVLESSGCIEKPKVEEQDWRWARPFTPPATLNAATIRWLAALPPEVRPIELPRSYARIANRLCELWPQPHACEQYFENLTREHRMTGDRQSRRNGFPGNIAREIDALKKHYFHPVETVVLWDHNMSRR